jgi:hypothetical protein
MAMRISALHDFSDKNGQFKDKRPCKLKQSNASFMPDIFRQSARFGFL